MSGSSLTEGGGKHPPLPSAALGGKSPVLLGLNESKNVELEQQAAIR